MSENRSPNRLNLPEGREKRFQSILERRARARGVSVTQIEEEARRERRTFQSVESRAQRLGMSIAELLAHDRELLQTSNYPGVECLEPYEVELYLAGQLPENRKAHVQVCSGCEGLIAALEPNPEQIDKLREAIREQMRSGIVVESPVKQPAFWSTVSDVVASMAPVAVALIIYLVSLKPAPLPAWQITVPGVVVLVLLAYGVAALWKQHRWIQFWRTSGGALLGAAGAAVVLIFVVSYTAEQKAVDTTRSFTAVQAVQQIAVTSLGQKLTTGEFPVASQSSGPLRVSTVSHAANRAVYEASTVGLPGTVIAVVRPDGGELFLQSANLVAGSSQSAREVRAKFQAGTVMSAEKGKLVLRDSTGSLHTLVVPDSVLPSVGQKAVVVVDPRSEEVRNISTF